MGARDVFVDSGAFHALLVRNDPHHQNAATWLQRIQKERRGLVTTDYIVDETVTLLKARHVSQQVPRFFEVLQKSDFLVLEWIGEDRFFTACDFLLKHSDHAWSFTDCTSFVVMKEMEICDALTADRHFHEAGFVPLLLR